MNTRTFVSIPEAAKNIIYSKYAMKSIPLPRERRDYEDIFYLTLDEGEYFTINGWMRFIHGGSGNLIDQNPKQVLDTLGWRKSEREGLEVLRLMASYEMQRWFEYFYIDKIENYGTGNPEVFEGCYIPDVIRDVILKYHLNNYPGEGEPVTELPTPNPVSETEWLRLEPEEEELSMEEMMQPVKRGRGRPKGSKDKAPRRISESRRRIVKPTTLITRAPPVITPASMAEPAKPGSKWFLSPDDIEKIRRDLMKCRTPLEISRELSKSDQTIYNVMDANMFEGRKSSLKKSIEGHANNVMRLVSRGDTTWDRYVRVYAICEKALIRKVYKMSPDFIFKYHLAPTRDTLVYDYEKSNHNLKMMATAYGVPAELVVQWLSQENVAHIILPKRGSVTSPRKDRDIAVVENSGGIESKYLLGRDRAKFRDY
jgi:hypothetical protein